jgi:hypothetical protein
MASYETDYYGWAIEQARRLRAGEPADLENIAEEIEDLAKRERRMLRNRFRVLVTHLLKWQYQPDRRCRSWEATIRVQREDACEILNDSPSLKSSLDEILRKAYSGARKDASIETGMWIDDFPVHCPWTSKDVLNEEFLPRGEFE